MSETIFDHDQLDVYRLSIDDVATSLDTAKNLNGCHHHTRDLWLRASQSLPLNIAESSGVLPVVYGDFSALTHASAVRFGESSCPCRHVICCPKKMDTLVR